MRYVISKAEATKENVRLFPFRKFIRNGEWREFGRADATEMIDNFDAGLPNSKIPINIEHNPMFGRIGTYKKLWAGKDGIYGQIEWTAIGKQYMQEDRFLFFSPEIRWEWTNPKTGKKHQNVLVGGAVTNYPFHGDDTALFSDSAQEHFDTLHKMGVLSINPRSIRNVSDKELLSLHHRMHQLAGSIRKGAPTAGDVHVNSIEEIKKDTVEKISIEDVVNAHVILVHEMRKRDLHHATDGDTNWLDRQSRRMMKSTASDVVKRLAEVEAEEIMIVPNFAAIVGSAVENSAPGDLDVLIRAEKEGRFYQISEQSLWLPLRNFIDPYKDAKLEMRWVPGAQGPHGDSLALGDLVLKIHPQFHPIMKSVEVEKDVRSYIYFVGTGAQGSPRREASLMIVSGRGAVLFDAGAKIKPKHLPRVPDVIILTNPTENMREARRLADELGVEVIHGDWGGPDMKITSFKASHNIFGYIIEMSDVRVAYVPEFLNFPTEQVQDIDVGIFDGSTFDAPIHAGGAGGHAPVTEILVSATQANVKRIVLSHIGESTDKHLGLLQAGGIEVAMDGQSLILKAALEPGRQNFKPLKTGRGYGENEFADPEVAWEVWGRSNKPFAVEKKYDGWRLMAHKNGDTVSLFSEDARQNLADKLPNVARSVAAMKGSFILDGELELYASESVTANFRYAAGDKIERIDMPSFLSADKPKGKFSDRYFVFDLIYRDGDLHRLPWTERRKALESLIHETNVLKIVSTKVVDNREQFLSAAREAFGRPHSEGAMLKKISAAYPLNGETIEWAKFKAFKEVRVRVVKKKRGGRGAWIYTVALSDGSIIGNTYATGVDAEVGDTLEMRVAEIKIKTEGDKKVFRWDNPLVHSKKPKGTALTTPVQAEQLARLRRGRQVNFSELIDALEWEEDADSELFQDTNSVLKALLELFGLSPISKPYSANNQLPKSVRNALPVGAQTIFRKAFNSASKYPEERRMKIAWAAVKNAGYHKGADGKWTS